MGCFLSKSDQSHFSKSPYPPPPPSQKRKPHPPPTLSPPQEEETVKEVLSETPTTKPSPIPKIEEPTTKPSPIPKIEEPKLSSVVPNIQLKEKVEGEEVEEEKKIPVQISSPVPVSVEEIYEHDVSSEICTVSVSVSETISTATMNTTAGDKNELEEGEVMQPRIHRSPQAKIPRKRSFPGDSTGTHQRGSKSPARRSDPSSPARRNNDLGRRRVSESNSNNSRIRRDSGESSGRRSRSPATRVNAGASRPGGVGRSPSRRSGRSPARAPVVAPEKNKKPNESKEAQEGNLTENNESIENPLVSLECFIFL